MTQCVGLKSTKLFEAMPEVLSARAMPSALLMPSAHDARTRAAGVQQDAFNLTEWRLLGVDLEEVKIQDSDIIRAHYSNRLAEDLSALLVQLDGEHGSFAAH